MSRDGNAARSILRMLFARMLQSRMTKLGVNLITGDGPTDNFGRPTSPPGGPPPDGGGGGPSDGGDGSFGETYLI